MLATLQKKNHGCTIISHRATFVYFWLFFLSPHGTGIRVFSTTYFFFRNLLFVIFVFSEKTAPIQTKINTGLATDLTQLQRDPSMGPEIRSEAVWVLTNVASESSSHTFFWKKKFKYKIFEKKLQSAPSRTCGARAFYGHAPWFWDKFLS